MDKNFIYKLIAAVSTISDNYSNEKAYLMEYLDGELTNIIAPPVVEEKRTRNLSGIVQVDAETGKEITRFKTAKEANAALGKKENSSCISDAANGRTSTHYAYGFKWYHCDEFDAM